MDLEHLDDGVLAELKRAGFLRVRHNGQVLHLDRFAQGQLEDGPLEVVVDRLLPSTKSTESVLSKRCAVPGP